MEYNLQKLAKMFIKLPGIGERQAKRFAYFILTQPQEYVESFADALLSARSLAHTCTKCYRIFEGNPGLCKTCSDDARDNSQLLVVEKSQDIDSFAKTNYQGLFFVLGGLIPIVQKNILAKTNLEKLKERLQKSFDASTRCEVILAFPVTPDGEHTDAVVRETLISLPGIELSSLGRGLSTGADLEYADAASLSASLKKRE